MKRVLIVVNRRKDAAIRAAERIERWLARRAEVHVAPEGEPGDEAAGLDLAVVLGGDGTMLAAARSYGRLGVPLVGINVSKFGFLTETEADEFESVLDDVLEGRCTVEQRMMLRCVLERDGEAALDTVAMNDAVVSRTSLSRAITIELHVDDELVSTYRADGLIVATPVGSTAHSLSAGGPIIAPDMEAILVTPICPHTMTNRPLVLPGGARVNVRVPESAEAPGLTVDGQVNRTMRPTDVLHVTRAEQALQLIRTGRHTFFDTLRNKLDWRGHPRYA